MCSLHKIKYSKFQLPAMLVFLVFHKSSITRSCFSFEDLSAYKISWSHVDWCKFCIHLSSFKIPPSPYSKGQLKKIIIQTQLVGNSPILHWTIFRLAKCNGSWFVSIRQYVNFKFQSPTMFVFFVFSKNGLLKSCSSSEDLSEYKIS
jgi:hypothetical protein